MSDAASLLDRAHRMHRRLVLLQSLFEPPPEAEDGWLASADKSRSQALTAAIREILDGLTEDAHTLTTIPSPLSQWRPGDAAGDERWRPLTEIERRDVLALVASCDHLISWGESFTEWVAGASAPALTGTIGPRLAAPLAPLAPEIGEATELLKAERARLNRLQHEMGFLERRRHAAS
jgi:hypothetical protein